MSFRALVLSAVLGLAVPSLATPRSLYVILGGLGGEPAFAKRFAEQAGELVDIYKKAAGEESLVYALYGNAATRESVVALLEGLVKQAHPADTLIITLIGHGSYDGYDYKFNIPGPDLTAAQLKELLDGIPAGDQLVVNTTSASGATLDLLKSERRVVIAATKSGRERTITIFPQYWLEALQDPAADTDKNETITALEAFRYAEEKVKGFYESEKRLATEHPQLAGELAANLTLARLGTALEAATDPGANPLLSRRDQLERQIAELKRKKSDMDAGEYERQLEKLLIELARLQVQIDRAVGKQ